MSSRTSLGYPGTSGARGTSDAATHEPPPANSRAVPSSSNRGVVAAVVTAAAVAVVASLMRHDVRSSTSVLRRNMRQMRVWMEEAAADVKPGEQTKLPGADKKPPHKDPSA